LVANFIAVLKQFLQPDAALKEKRLICEVVKMLVGLRKSWSEAGLHEDSPTYDAQAVALFPHERLHVYQVGLEFINWSHSLPGGAELSSRLLRQVDKAATSVVLNIAERNGRFPEGDRRSFLEIAEASAVKAAVHLDLCVHEAQLEPAQREWGVQCLGRITLMLRGLSLS
jgi:four helix bundle protein